MQDLAGSSAGRCGRGTRKGVQTVLFSACDQPGGGNDEIAGSMLARWFGCRFGWSLVCGSPTDRPFLVSSVLPRLFSPRTGPLRKQGNTQGKPQNSKREKRKTCVVARAAYIHGQQQQRSSNIRLIGVYASSRSTVFVVALTLNTLVYWTRNRTINTVYEGHRIPMLRKLQQSYHR